MKSYQKNPKDIFRENVFWGSIFGCSCCCPKKSIVLCTTETHHGGALCPTQPTSRAIFRGAYGVKYDTAVRIRMRANMICIYIYIKLYCIYIYTCIQRYIHTSCKWIQLDGCERFVLFYNTLDNTACILLHVSFL